MKKPAKLRFSKKLALSGVSLAVASLAVSQFGSVTAQPAAATPVPGGTAATDQMAWAFFVRAVRPSATQGKLAYETWASDQDIYVQNPCAPPPASQSGCNIPTWPVLKAPKLLTSSTKPHRGFSVEGIGPKQGCGSPNGSAPGFPSNGCVGEEVRRDRASFNYIVQNGLWSKAGLSNYFSGGGTVTFPANALNVKADWIPVDQLATWLGKPRSFVTANFYTAIGNLDAKSRVLMALTSMHVSVKAPGYPNWVWANFENAYTPGRCDLTGCVDNFGAVTATVAPKAAWSQYGTCAKSPAAARLLRGANVPSVFNNYCLTGTQVNYVDGSGNATVLSSPIIEPLNAGVPTNQSSCITCHQGASFNASGVAGPVKGGIGNPQPLPTGAKAYDFMWGILFAQ